MNEFALIETFSGDKLFSEKYPLNEYYDDIVLSLTMQTLSSGIVFDFLKDWSEN